MFGLFKKKKKAGKSTGKSREKVMENAMRNVRAARAEIGDETLDKISDAIRKKEESDFERARAKIKAMDEDRIADNLRSLLDEK